MTRFEDMVLGPGIDPRKSQTERLKVLKRLMEENPAPVRPPLISLFSNDPIFFASIINPPTSLFIKLNSRPEISAMICQNIDADSLEIRTLLNDCQKQTLSQIYQLSEETILEARLMGFSGGLVTFDANDLALTQFHIELGTEYGFECVLNCMQERDIRAIPFLDAPVIKTHVNFHREVKTLIPSTRGVIFEIDSLEQIEELSELPHKLAFIINEKISNFI